jgi:hypothetical protein
MAGVSTDPITPLVINADSPGRLTRHESRCGICSHPERRAIETVFQDRQTSVAIVANRYGIGRDALYRHAHAIGLSRIGQESHPAQVESASTESDNGAMSANRENATLAAEDKSYTVTQCAEALIDLLQIPPSEELIGAVEQAIQAHTSKNQPAVEGGANEIYIAAMKAKLFQPPDNWLTWFVSFDEACRSDVSE